MSSSTEIKKYIHIFIVLFLFFGFRFIPPIEPITEIGMGVIGVLLGVIYGWTFIEIGWVSILAISAFVLTGVATIGQVYTISIGSDTIMLTVTILIFAGILDQSGTTNFMLNWILTRKIIKGKPWFFSFVMFIACMLLSTTSGFPILIIFINMLITLAKQVGIKPYSKYITCMCIGLTFASLYGSILFPFKPTPLILMGVYTNLTGATINAISYLLVAVFLAVLTLFVYTLLCRFLFKIDVSLIADIDMQKLGINEIKATMQQKIIMFATLAMIVLLLFPSFVSAENILTQTLTTIGSSGTVFCIMVLLNIIKIDGQPVAVISKAASKGVAWDTIFLCIIIMALSAFVGSPATGINVAIEQIFAPLLASMGPVIFLAGLLIIAVILTNFLNNLLVATVFIPVVVSVAPMLGLAVEPLVVLLILTVHLAVALPAASPFAAVMFSFSDWVRVKEATPLASIAIIILTIMYCSLGYFLAMLII